jgi:hypothetical protein
MSDVQTASQLIQSAFDRARQSGKPDWWCMAIPVLKNRLLQLTSGEFRENAYGAHSLRDFVNRNSDILRFEEKPFPGFVILTSAEPSQQKNSSLKNPPPEVSSDLWQSVIDFSSGTKYIWDEPKRKARPAAENEEGVRMPTLSAEEMDAWRAEFSEMHRPEDKELDKRLEDWRQQRLPTQALPVPLRTVWNRYLKGKVQNRLSSWFTENNLTEPRRENALAPVSRDEQCEKLREFVISCVKYMSRAELEELRISPAIVMRAVKG